MSTIQLLAASIVATAADYRNGELGPFTAEHVTRRTEQFSAEDRLGFLAELDHVLKKTYFSESAVTDFLQSLRQGIEARPGRPRRTHRQIHLWLIAFEAHVLAAYPSFAALPKNAAEFPGVRITFDAPVLKAKRGLLVSAALDMISMLSSAGVPSN